MLIEDLERVLNDNSSLDLWLTELGVKDIDRARSNLLTIARSGMTLDQLGSICGQIVDSAAEISDLDMALNNLEKFVLAARSALALGALFQRDPTAIPILLRIFSSSQHFGDLLVRDAESYDSLRLTEGQLYSRNLLVDELVASVDKAVSSMHAMQILRRFKQRESLRIAFGDLIVEHRLEKIAEQISWLAEAIVEAALFYAWRQIAEQWGQPENPDGTDCRFVLLALGKLGGRELNYSSDIDLIAVFESAGKATPSGKTNQQFFERVTRETIKLLTESTSLGAVYRVDMRLRPQGRQGPVCSAEKAFLQYYEIQGRTWERQALIKARPIAGNLDYGRELLKRLEPWIYRPVLNRFDIGGIKALKRQIEKQARTIGEENTNVKTGHGGIRDIEFTIQFLQLLHGGVIRSVRVENTIEAIRVLAGHHCLSQQEADLLDQNYCWLRKLEHLLQIMFDLQTHTLPTDLDELGKIAFRMGYREYFGASALVQFENDYSEITSVNRQILNHLLHDAFSSASSDSVDEESELVDLVLQHDVPLAEWERLLKPLGFSECQRAMKLIEGLGRESTIFLSSRRCRHFLAAIIKPLITRIAATPAPDETLVSLASVAEALGGKGALWELFRFNPPSLELFVRLCAASDYLTMILRHNPGMIDELIDSLSLDRLPSIEWLAMSLDEVVANAVDVRLILQSFKNSQHLRVGIRDILGRDPIRETHRALSDIAEVSLAKIVDIEFEKIKGRFSNNISNEKEPVQNNALVVLALGKLGGQEPNYHSDLDVVFIYDPEQGRHDWINTSPQHFYSELAGQVTRFITSAELGEKLFDLDCRLRPTGRSGALAVSLREFQRYFKSGSGQLWERLALCKARPVYGDQLLKERVMDSVHDILSDQPWHPEMAGEIRSMRFKMQKDCRAENLKRGIGGTVDVEFITEMLQLKHASRHPEILVAGTIEGLNRLIAIKAISPQHGYQLIEGYQFLRGVEARLRLMNTTARHDLPAGKQLQRLAFLLKIDASQLEESIQRYRNQNRELFTYLFDQAQSDG